MTYIENIFLCLALPMLLSLLFTSGSPRRFTLFVVLGMATCLLSAYVSSFFMGRHQCSAVTTAIEIAPVCEEILKLLPLLKGAKLNVNSKKSKIPQTVPWTNERASE